MDLAQSFTRLGIALALGLLVGIQRERSDSRVAGIRTFPLITLFGAITALASLNLGTWLVAAGVVALAALLVISNVAKLQLETDPGLTTEVAALLMYGVGAYLIVGHMEVAVAVGGAVAVLLHLKQPLHRFVEAMGERDVTAVMQFVLITCIILPILPDRAFGPYEVLNPRRIWLMVVLIVAISLGGYVTYKLMGARASSLLAGILGGLISSTATTVSYARRTAEAEGSQRDRDDLQQRSRGMQAIMRMATVVIVVASAVSFARVLVEVAVVAPLQFRAIGAPLGLMLVWMIVLSVIAWMMGRGKDPGELPEPENPAELKPALIFGLLYAIMIFAVAFVKNRFGNVGLYPIAIISGLTDMDAITLSTANLAREGRLDTSTTWRLILVAALANTLFKGAIAILLGSRALRGRVILFFALALAGGIAVLLLWPLEFIPRLLKSIGIG